MNQVLKDWIGIAFAMWVTFFVQALFNPEAVKKRPDLNTGSFIALAYFVGGRTKKSWTKE